MTLIEMLIATALVVLMMILFSQIFGGAIQIIRSQRGLAQNDQKARTVVTTIKNDFDRMTYRQLLSGDVNGIVALSPGDEVDARQLGFFYYSENDPLDDTDDVLHFTVDINETLRDATASNLERSPFYGRARTFDPLPAFPVAGPHRNYPEFDDGNGPIAGNPGNNTGSSRAAEVVLFLRGGNLYRRVLLLRDPLTSASPPFDAQPTLGPDGAGGPNPMFSMPYYNTFAPPFQSAATAESFYNDFDYSCTRVLTVDDGNGSADPEGVDSYRVQFHSMDSLNNSLGRSNVPLGIPQNRFGFHASDGRPREFLLNAGGTPTSYIGRHTHEETSSPLFTYPGAEDDPAIGTGSINVMTSRSLTLNRFNTVRFQGTNLNGPRAGEDILLTNVEAFDVKIWDTGYFEPDNNPANGTLDPAEDFNGNGIRDNGLWVDLGNAFGRGQYTLVNAVQPTWRNRNPGYGSLPGAPNRVFDTWHPSAGRNYDGDAALRPNEIRPPYRPTVLDSLSSPTVIDFWMRGTPPTSTTYSAGDLYFPNRLGFDGLPGLAGSDDDGDGNIDFLPGGGLDTDEIGWPGSDDGPQSIGYRVISGGLTGARRPEFPLQAGAIVRDGGVIWEAFDNRIGLQRILITIRYRDVNTDQAGQVTIVHSFVE